MSVSPMASPPKSPEAERAQTWLRDNGDLSESPDVAMAEAAVDAFAGGLEFEIKEQDRWLPIANGTYMF